MHGWSITPRAAGTMPLAITADTASPAVRRALKSASSVRTARATGRRRTLIRVAIPKFPSEPTNRPTRSGPHGSPPGLPSSTTRPSASTTSRPSTWFAVTPYLRQCGPPAFSATLPPMVQAGALDLGVAAAAPVAARPLAHCRPALGVGRHGTQHGRELAQPGTGAPDRLQHLLRRRVELERRRHLERQALRIARQLDLLVLPFGEHAERPREANESFPHVCGDRRHFRGIGRVVVEFLDLGDAVRMRARDPRLQHETTLAHRLDIGAPVEERLVRPDQGHTPHVARHRHGIGAG